MIGIGERASVWIARHPHVIRLATGALVVLTMANLVAAIELDLRGRDLVGRMQRETSEALGG